MNIKGAAGADWVQECNRKDRAENWTVKGVARENGGAPPKDGTAVVQERV